MNNFPRSNQACRPFRLITLWGLAAAVAAMLSASPLCSFAQTKDEPQPVEKLVWEKGPAQKRYFFVVDSPSDPPMVQLRETFGLDKLVAKAKSDLERVKIMTAWVHSQWEHKGDVPPPKNDPIMILMAARAGERFSCREYALVLADCLNSIGIKSRIVELLPKDVESGGRGNYHIVTEAFLPDIRKWAMADAQWNTVPTYRGAALSLIELQGVIADGKFKGLHFGGEIADSMTIDYPRKLAKYLYFFRVGFNNRVQTTDLPISVMGRRGLMLMPVGAKLSDSFYSVTKGRVQISHNPTEFYGVIQ